MTRIRDRPDADQIHALATQLLAQASEWSTPPPLDARPQIAKLSVYPSGRAIDPELTRVLAESWNKPGMSQFGLYAAEPQVAGLFADLNGDGVDEFILLTPWGGPVYQHRSGRWEYAGDLHLLSAKFPWPSVLAELERGNIATPTPQWRDMTLGANRYRVTTEP